MFIRSMLLAGSLLLIGCSGGSDDGDNYNSPPVVADTIPPVITLNGSATYYVQIDTSYIEPGAIAMDNVDGVSSVKITGNVDVSVLGDYAIHYSSTDSSYNTSTKTRTVTVTLDEVQNVGTTIDVLALYNQEAYNLYDGDIETRLNHLITFANIINQNSEVDLNLKLVHSEEYYFNQGFSSDTILIDATNDTNIQQIREAHSADEVFIYRPYSDDEMCGLAWINTPLSPNYAYAHITVDCPSDTTAHEAGHNFGLAHSHKQDDPETPGIFPYSFGHGIDNEFVTVMAYQTAFSVNETEMVYSNPELTCKGMPCGIEEGYEGEADAARTIREVKDTISNYY